MLFTLCIAFVAGIVGGALAWRAGYDAGWNDGYDTGHAWITRRQILPNPPDKTPWWVWWH